MLFNRNSARFNEVTNPVNTNIPFKPEVRSKTERMPTNNNHNSDDVSFENENIYKRRQSHQIQNESLNNKDNHSSKQQN